MDVRCEWTTVLLSRAMIILEVDLIGIEDLIGRDEDPDLGHLGEDEDLGIDRILETEDEGPGAEVMIEDDDSEENVLKTGYK